MSRVLLDVNVLIALVDPSHEAHERVHQWAQEGLDDGWATCALTENGLVRILSMPAYPGHVSVPDALGLLAQLTGDARHEFWSCDTSIAAMPLRTGALLGARQVTDAYLLALAVERGGRFATLDVKIRPDVVAHPGAEDALVVIG